MPPQLTQPSTWAAIAALLGTFLPHYAPQLTQIAQGGALIAGTLGVLLNEKAAPAA